MGMNSPSPYLKNQLDYAHVPILIRLILSPIVDILTTSSKYKESPDDIKASSGLILIGALFNN